MMLTRATIPAWMEMFKHNLPKIKREQLVGYGTTIDFLGTALLAVGAGIVLDHYPHMWKGLFSLTAVLGILSTFLFIAIPPPKTSATFPSTPPEPNDKQLEELAFHTGSSATRKKVITTKNPFLRLSAYKILQPWKQVWQLVSQRKDFTYFQIGFMFCGAGLMIMQPALPQFFIDVLNLSFVEMGLAIALCKGIGVALTSPFWTLLFRKTNIFQLSALVAFFAMLFPFFLLASTFNLLLLYFAYALYGIMQAGSELSWHMLGLVFAQEKDSSTFSITNVVTVGIRGCVIPALGSMLLLSVNSLGVILIGAFLCFLALCSFLLSSRSLKQHLIKREGIG